MKRSSPAFGWLLLAAGIAVSATGAEIEGTVLPYKTVTVSAPVQEIIDAVEVEEGDSVTENDVLASLRHEQEILELKRYGQLIKKATFEADAAEKLHQSGSGTESEAIDKKTELEKLESERALVNLRLEEKTVRSPLDGIVVVKLVEKGESVEQVEDMFEIVNIDQIFLRFYIDAAYLRTVKEGQEVKVVYPLFPERAPSPATVDFIDSQIDPGSGLVRIKLIAENADHQIKAGMRVRLILPDLEPARTAAPAE